MMIKFTLRVDDDKLVKQFDALAQVHGMSRTAYIVQMMRDAVNAGFIPIRDGEGFRGITSNGGEITLIRHNDYVSGGMKQLDEAELAAFEQAKRVADPEYGSRWMQAREILEEAGFTVYRL